MKKLSVIFLLSLVSLLATAQHDDVKSIELTEGQKDPVEEELDYCKLSIYTTSSRNGSSFNITVIVENTKGYDIFLFGRSYDEKSLKKHKIRFSKDWVGSKNIVTCEGCKGDESMRIEPGGRRNLHYEIGNSASLELPLYISKYKPKKFLSSEKFIILRNPKVTLNIEVIPENRVDEAYEKLNSDYEELLEELNEKTLCPRNSHGVSLEKQEEEYKSKIQDMLEEIKSIKKKNKWRDSSDEYQNYKELKEKLEEIDFTKYEKWCGECSSVGTRRKVDHTPAPTPVHQCRYCNKSLSDVLKSLEHNYQKLENGESKSSVMGEVNDLHNAWTRGCPKLSKKKRDESGKSNQIDNYYNRIVNY